MLKVILLRHGETTANADGNRYCGRTDIELTSKGLGQATTVAELLAGISIDAVYASPLQRARITAELASGGRQVVTDDRLIEVDFGNWEGKTRAEFVAEAPGLWDRWCADPATAKAGGTGETGAAIVERVTAFFEEKRQQHNGQTILVVAHNGVNRLFMASMLGMPLAKYRSVAQENASITYFEWEDSGEFILKKLNAHSI